MTERDRTSFRLASLLTAAAAIVAASLIAPPVARSAPPKPADSKGFWSFQPVKRPDVPQVKRKEWVRNPVDAFILAKLEAKGLAPAPQAEKVALLRRATYDLTGLPPT